METQSIIVYRNPMEQAFWEGGFLWPLIVAMIAAFIAALLSNMVLDMLATRSSFVRKHIANITVLVVGLTMIGTLFIMI